MVRPPRRLGVSEHLPWVVSEYSSDRAASRGYGRGGFRGNSDLIEGRIMSGLRSLALLAVGAFSLMLPSLAIADTSAATSGAGAASTVPADSPLEGTWETEPGGPSVHYACYGSGSPAIILEAGTDSGGSQVYSPN